MATVQELLQVKSSQVHSIGPDATVLDAAVYMNEHKIGCLPVVDGEDELVGLITETDVLRYFAGIPPEPG